jgi:hypothetical protein
MPKYNLCVIFYVPKASSVLAIAVAVATLVPVSIGLSGLGPEIKIGGRQTLGIYNNAPRHLASKRAKTRRSILFYS